MKEPTHIGEYPNGYWLDENSDADSIAASNMYIVGVADGLFAGRHSLDDSYCRDNPNLDRNNIIDAVRLYYRQKPENKFRQIVAVIRSGCR